MTKYKGYDKFHNRLGTRDGKEDNFELLKDKKKNLHDHLLMILF